MSCDPPETRVVGISKGRSRVGNEQGAREVEEWSRVLRRRLKRRRPRRKALAEGLARGSGGETGKWTINMQPPHQWDAVRLVGSHTGNAK